MSTGLGISTGAPRHQPAFQLPSSSSSSSSPSPHHPPDTNDTSSDPDDLRDDNVDDAPLPFPTELSRRDFLAPGFNAASYLSSLFPGGDETLQGLGLGTRHQTLEDLRTELRERSSAISSELLELVNANYTSFLGLGDELKGGEERVEDVRVALLGFRRQVEEVQARVRGRKEDVQRVGGELRDVRGEVEQGRRMLELDERLDVLLGRLEDEIYEEESEDDDSVDDEARSSGRSPASLMEMAREHSAINKLADAIGRDVPYVKKMEERITRSRNALLLELGVSVKEARKGGEKKRDTILMLLGLYRLLGAHAESVKALKEK